MTSSDKRNLYDKFWEKDLMTSSIYMTSSEKRIHMTSYEKRNLYDKFWEK